MIMSSIYEWKKIVLSKQKMFSQWAFTAQTKKYVQLRTLHVLISFFLYFSLTCPKKLTFSMPRKNMLGS